MATAPNVLPFFDPPGQKSLLEAYAKCVRDVQSKHDLDDIDLAEKLACSDETIRNVKARKHLLSGVPLARLEYFYGEEAVEPIRKLTRRFYAPEPETTEEKRRRLIRELAALEEV